MSSDKLHLALYVIRVACEKEQSLQSMIIHSRFPSLHTNEGTIREIGHLLTPRGRELQGSEISHRSKRRASIANYGVLILRIRSYCFWQISPMVAEEIIRNCELVSKAATTLQASRAKVWVARLIEALLSLHAHQFELTRATLIVAHEVLNTILLVLAKSPSEPNKLLNQLHFSLSQLVFQFSRDSESGRLDQNFFNSLVRIDRQTAEPLHASRLRLFCACLTEVVCQMVSIVHLFSTKRGLSGLSGPVVHACLLVYGNRAALQHFALYLW